MVGSANRNRKLLAAAAVGVIALALSAGGAWYFIVRDDGAFNFVIPNEAPAPVSLDAALESVTDIPAAGGPAEPGTWTVAPEHSFAGYRVRETLATFGANTAVGRTSDIEGTLEYDGSAITRLEVTADLTTLTSDQGERDDALRDQAIETDLYPTATFVLAEPLAVEEVPPEGEAVSRTVAGDLTLHGVTREVDVEVEGALHEGRLVVVGSTEIRLADYDIERPVSFSVLSIEDHGVMEFQLVFEPAEAQ